MSLATYKDLCIDATDPLVTGRFWAAALGLQTHVHDDGDVHLTGSTPQHTIWVNRVPEPRTVKQRLHLDIRASSVGQVVDLGAQVLDADSFRWTVMADPEGGELCVFVRDAPIDQPFYALVVDCAAHAKAATWWSTILGGTLEHHDEYSTLEAPGTPFEALLFITVPEPKRVKNRIHLDVTTGDVHGLLAAGATLLRAKDGDIGWHVMADPEGNEFCAFTD